MRESEFRGAFRRGSLDARRGERSSSPALSQLGRAYLARLLSDLVQRVERRGRRAVEAALLALVAAAPRDLIDCAFNHLVRNFLYLDARDAKLLQILVYLKWVK